MTSIEVKEVASNRKLGDKIGGNLSLSGKTETRYGKKITFEASRFSLPSYNTGPLGDLSRNTQFAAIICEHHFFHFIKVISMAKNPHQFGYSSFLGHIICWYDS
jgi:hypothetical protein